jgi:hypothetical protein
MRHNVRPFVTVYKNRSSKSRKSNLWGTHLLGEADSKPSPAAASAVPHPMIKPEERYPAPRRLAAQEIFSSGRAAEPIATIAPSAAPTGRILPCLLQSDGQIAPQKEPSENVRRARATKKRIKVEAIDTKAPEPRVKASSTDRPVAAVETPHSAARQDSAPPRRGSRIQDRWVRKAELRPGERWKRRLSDAAR